MRPPRRPRLRRLAVAALLGTVAVLGPAAPAAAHTVGGIDATNYRTTIRSVRPDVRAVTVRVVDNGDRIELTNTGRVDVVVLGYDDEPYLRVGPRGAFENVRSPAWYLNRDRRDPDPPPPSADPEAPPEWRRIGSGDTVRWHDHRAHWMSDRDPPVVRRAPDREHLVQDFEIQLVRGDEVIRVRGDLRWVPGPSPWPWIAGAAVLAVVTVVAARTRRAAAAVLGAVLGVAMAGAVIHAVAAWTFASAAASVWSRVDGALPTAGSVALGLLALVRLHRAGLRAAAPLLVFAGLFVAIAVGLADMGALSKSQIPTDLSPTLDRLTITLALGGGFGVAIGAALHIADRSPRRGPDGADPGPDPGADPGVPITGTLIPGSLDPGSLDPGSLEAPSKRE